MRKYSLLLSVLFVMLLVWSKDCYAREEYTNPDTGYSVIVDDQAELLAENLDTELDLLEEMKPISKYGNVAFISTYEVRGSTSSYASNLYYNMYQRDSGIIFLIDMNNRQLWLETDGEIGKIITVGYANTITDNVYKDASKGLYYRCAQKTFNQIYTLLEGGKISQPMKVSCNALLALVISLIVNFLIVAAMTSRRKASNSEVIRDLIYKCQISNVHEHFTHETRRYDPPSSSSSGGGGGHGGGGGGGSHGGGHGF